MRHKERRKRIERQRDKKGEVEEVRFGERVFIMRARGDREIRRDT